MRNHNLQTCKKRLLSVCFPFPGTPCITDAYYFNTFHAAGVSRRQVKHFTKVLKMSTFWNLVTNIWNHHLKCIQISTNMPGIGLEISEISIILRNKTILHGWWNGMAACKVLIIIAGGHCFSMYIRGLPNNFSISLTSLFYRKLNQYQTYLLLLLLYKRISTILEILEMCEILSLSSAAWKW